MATKERIKLAAELRTITGRRNKGLRRQGMLPGRIFGHGDIVLVQINGDTFKRLRDKHQTTGVIDMHIAGLSQPETVLVRHIDHKPSNGSIEHIDFLRVALNETLTAHIPLHITGTSPAARQTNGMVLLLLESLDIEALPDDLPEFIEIDAAKLVDANTILHASDIALPQGVTLRTPPDEAVAKIQAMRGEEAPAAPTTTEEATPAEATASQP